MKYETNVRGFRSITSPALCHGIVHDEVLLQESSKIGDYPDAIDNPGSSCLWVGEHHLDREQVNELIGAMHHWLQHKRMPTWPVLFNG